ncbi:MAG: hypothetical protein M1834_001622 [Cirrosporium novae-zelandiae]|nr:MAG: hypothetical protein M1834_004139 [Cirrosporium novae-zelandiae]KAI9735606.1 MAG: hypothetical protein M1834_001622 [Cirrosporium novae-zelandiae]
MGMSKSTRMITLLAIDSVFFLIEISCGYAVHSLALVADSFHMLNDVISLLVGLWAVKVAQKGTVSARYTYGWQRAETLGALFNGVFLVALCLSIFLDAIQRFVEPQEIKNPMIVLVVGCFGLASNLVGLLLFHDHSHGPSEGEHSHQEDEIYIAEEGRYHDIPDQEAAVVLDEGENVTDILPQSTVAGWPSTGPMINDLTTTLDAHNRARSAGFTSSDENDSTVTRRTSHSGTKTRRGSHRSQIAHRRHGSTSRQRGFAGVDSISVHPASFRNEIIAASKMEDIPSRNESESEEAIDDNGTPDDILPPLNGTEDDTTQFLGEPNHGQDGNGHKRHDSWHIGHHHTKAKKPGAGHGHSHDLNMRGVFLHVMGDALGNIGVIGSALFIWLTSYSWRFYADPLISLIITCVILASAIPLCLAASRILLQATPEHISVSDISDDISELDGVVGCHHLHVWQLSDSKLVASLHVQVSFDFKHAGAARYMELAHAIRRCLHEYGIHSSTIQPEFCLDSTHDHSDSSGNGSSTGHKRFTNPNGSVNRAASERSIPDACLLDCGDECPQNGPCCRPAKEIEYHDEPE